MSNHLSEENSPFTAAEMTVLLPHLHAYAKFKLRSHHEAEDLVQEAIERAWRSRRAFDRGGNLKAWLVAILRNCLIDHMRKGQSVTRRMEKRPIDSAVTLPDQLVRLEHSDFMKSLDVLKPNEREAIALVSAGLTHEEAAQVMNCPLGTLKSNVRRGRETLARLDSKPPQKASKKSID